MTLAEVKLWGRTIGAVSLEDGGRFTAFQYDPAFAGSGIEVSPITMPLGDRVFLFPDLPERTFHALPGLLADSLPDRFGTTLIDAWLSTQGRTPQSFNAVERLCYTGARGMGALEFVPALGPKPQPAKQIGIDALVKLASEILSQRKNLKTSFAGNRRKNALNDILRVGTSAGGARAKAVIAWNPETNEVRSGQAVAEKGFGYWLLKFDGVTGNKDKELEDPKGYGAIEYAYSLMAKAAGLTMSECRLLEESGRRHFMSRRFDRLEGGDKLHMQSLCALAHFDFNHAGAYSYEQALLTIRQLNLPMEAVEEQFRRMTFNIIARNQDDHVKNIAFPRLHQARYHQWGQGVHGGFGLRFLAMAGPVKRRMPSHRLKWFSAIQSREVPQRLGRPCAHGALKALDSRRKSPRTVAALGCRTWLASSRWVTSSG